MYGCSCTDPIRMFCSCSFFINRRDKIKKKLKYVNKCNVVVVVVGVVVPVCPSSSSSFYFSSNERMNCPEVRINTDTEKNKTYNRLMKISYVFAFFFSSSIVVAIERAQLSWNHWHTQRVFVCETTYSQRNWKAQESLTLSFSHMNIIYPNDLT